MRSSGWKKLVFRLGFYVKNLYVSVGANFARNAVGLGDFQADELCYQDISVLRTGILFQLIP